MSNVFMVQKRELRGIDNPMVVEEASGAMVETIKTKTNVDNVEVGLCHRDIYLLINFIIIR